jgi:hypothetical protein
MGSFFHSSTFMLSVMEALGHTGLQLFIDAGQPVDSSLVNSLVKECLLEKVVSMLGQKPDENRTSMSQARTDTKMSTAGVREQEETGYVREVKILDEMHKLFIQEIFGKNMGYVRVISHCITFTLTD